MGLNKKIKVAVLAVQGAFIEHEKMLEDDLKGIESKLTKQFLQDSKFILNQINSGNYPNKLFND